MGADLRHWCAEASYPRLERFIVGTVHLPRQDGESAARVALERMMLEHLPTGFTIHAALPGEITFAAEGEP